VESLSVLRQTKFSKKNSLTAYPYLLIEEPGVSKSEIALKN
jgi:hypothetical protein